MIEVPVTLGERSYTVAIEEGALDRAGTLLAPYARRRRLVIVTDENVAAHHLLRLTGSLEGAGIAAVVEVLPPGEGTKSWAQLAALTDRLLGHGIERSDYIVAFGGGVIGDLVGFAASILKRGCGFVQVPTTLLAQVDSSVGGKTAINSAAGKNLVGAFHQPAYVLIDPTTLDTLPQRELRAGYAEVVKYGLIDDAAFFAWCEANGPKLLAGDAAARTYAIRHSVAAKARIVAADERETTGVRALLNLGHTFGHALEAETGFSHRLLHGEGVAAGMALAFRYSARTGLCGEADAARVTAHLRAAGLPTTLEEASVNTSGETLIAHMAHDKKMSGGRLPFLLARGIGETFLAKDVELGEVAAFLEEERQATASGQEDTVIATSCEAVILWRPVGPVELRLIKQADMAAFPPRLPEQPIFYPVTTEEYAIKIARDWNVPASGSGFVTRFRIRADYLAHHNVQEAGGRAHQEYWIPADELDAFNAAIVGRIEVVHEFS